MLVNGFWCFVGTPIPASDSNDVGLAEIDLDNWKRVLILAILLLLIPFLGPLLIVFKQ